VIRDLFTTVSLRLKRLSIELKGLGKQSKLLKEPSACKVMKSLSTGIRKSFEP
jgi:hypothetical protein